MTPKGRTGGKTPERVVTLITEAVSKSSQSAVARESGLGLLTVQRCLKGIGEPSQATLEKLAAYFGVTVAWLRGETPDNELFKNYPWPSTYDMWAIMLSSAEAAMVGAIEAQNELITDELSVQEILNLADKYSSMSENLSAKFNQLHLAEVKALADKVKTIFRRPPV